jgi:hypothetical protein
LFSAKKPFSQSWFGSEKVRCKVDAGTVEYYEKKNFFLTGPKHFSTVKSKGQGRESYLDRLPTLVDLSMPTHQVFVHVRIDFGRDFEQTNKNKKKAQRERQCNQR